MSTAIDKTYEGFMVLLLCGEVTRKDQLQFTERQTAKILITLTSPQANKYAKNGHFYNKNRIIFWGRNAEEIAVNIKCANKETGERGSYISVLCRRSGGEVYPDSNSFGHSFTAERFKIWDNPQDLIEYFEQNEFKQENIIRLDEVV